MASPYWTSNTETGTQGLGGTTVSMSDLGLAIGNTDGTSGGGRIDLSAVNGVPYNKRVPEPSTCGAIFMGLSATFFGWRRFRRGVSAAAA